MVKKVIHIGANKAASTTLQRAMFANHSGLNYLGEDGLGYLDYCDAINSMIYDDDLHFQAKKCDELFACKLEGAPEKTFLYSSEDVMTSAIPFLCAQRLKKYLPDASILIILRNQYTAVPSFYINHGAFLKPAPPSYFHRHVEFDDWMEFQLIFNKYGPLASYFYNKLISVYEDLFGQENINVLLYEEFVRDQNSFVNKLCKILSINSTEAIKLLKGRHERQSIKKRQRVYNRIARGTFGCFLPKEDALPSPLISFLQKGPKAKLDLNDYWKKRIFDLYSAENGLIAKKYDLPLDEYEYPIL